MSSAIQWRLTRGLEWYIFQWKLPSFECHLSNATPSHHLVKSTHVTMFYLSETGRVIGQQSQSFPTHAYLAVWRLCCGNPAGLSRRSLATVNSSSWATTLRRLRDDSFSCIDSVPTCFGQTDGRTHARTEWPVRSIINITTQAYSDAV